VVQAMNMAAAEFRVCGGNAGSVLQITIDDEPLRPVEVCPKCGRTPRVVQLIVECADTPQTAQSSWRPPAGSFNCAG
jgi:hypothetical protein